MSAYERMTATCSNRRTVFADTPLIHTVSRAKFMQLKLQPFPGFVSVGRTSLMILKYVRL